MDIKLLEKYIHSEEYLKKAKEKIEFFNQDFRNADVRIFWWNKFRKNIVDFCEKCLVVYEPRAPKFKEIIFIPFEHQKKIFTELDNAYKNKGDLFIEKSRDLGVSYTVLAWILHRWLFEPGFSALVGSRKESEVDNRLNTSLFGKLRFMLYSLPKWLAPAGFKKRFHDSHMKLINPENGSVIEGESANPNFGRGKRASVIFADEIFFWPFMQESIRAMYDSSPVRFFVSTPDKNAFAKRFVESLKSQNRVLTIEWKEHPFKTLEWYNEEKIKRSANPGAIISELDISYDITTDEAYYPEAFQCEVKPLKYDPNYNLYIGIDTASYKDYTALIWAQYIDGELRILGSLLTHGRLMPNKNLIDWFLPYFSKKIPLNERNWYEGYEWDTLLRVREYDDPFMLCGESNLKYNAQVIGKSWDQYLNEVFNKYGIKCFIDINENKTSFAERRNSAAKMLKTTVFNNDQSALMVLDALKSTRKSFSETQDKVVPKNKPGDKDIRAAFENLSCSIEKQSFSFRAIDYV
jgi:hypothetical protein